MAPACLRNPTLAETPISHFAYYHLFSRDQYSNSDGLGVISRFGSVLVRSHLGMR